MMTDELIEIMKTDPDLAELGTHIRSGHLPALVNGVCENALPLFCRAVTKYAAAKPLIIVPDEKSAYGLAKRLEEPDEKPVLVFPARDLMFDRVSASSKEFEQERLKVLSAIRKGVFGCDCRAGFGHAVYGFARGAYGCGIQTDKRRARRHRQCCQPANCCRVYTL